MEYKSKKKKKIQHDSTQNSTWKNNTISTWYEKSSTQILRCWAFNFINNQIFFNHVVNGEKCKNFVYIKNEERMEFEQESDFIAMCNFSVKGA